MVIRTATNPRLTNRLASIVVP
nr:unnamed protein product [Callosobruchus chinensis]